MHVDDQHEILAAGEAALGVVTDRSAGDDDLDAASADTPADWEQAPSVSGFFLIFGWASGGSGGRKLGVAGSITFPVVSCQSPPMKARSQAA